MYTAKELAQMIGATVSGDPDVVVSAICTVHDLVDGCIFPLLKKRYAFALDEGQIVLTTPDIAASGVLGTAGTLLVHPVALIALARLIDLYFPETPVFRGVHPDATVSADADIHPSVAIGPRAVIEDGVSIDEGTVIGAGAVICRNSAIGRFVRIGPGAVIGHEGFGFIPTAHTIMKIPQVGGVRIGDFVEVGANSCIDRGTIGITQVGFGSKIDNLVQIGHNVRIGDNVIIAAQSGIAGSTTIEDSVLVGGQAGVADHLNIGTGARIGAKSGVIGDVSPGDTVAGYPAMNRWQWLKMIAAIKRETTRKSKS
ncbi:MAG: UDP-3-O-(3-hydroxymyristoyl)glucosamine N-acyltransferase [Deltaproteobacteria bacterium]|nr:UDP-3-O-(3-hydroxymyristoyl)glucosamine N-acyltransferase [Deltaproteobacteria bacterium]